MISAIKLLQSVAAIGDYVWSDANNNGIQDPGEVGIGGVTVVIAGRFNRSDNHHQCVWNLSCSRMWPRNVYRCRDGYRPII